MPQITFSDKSQIPDGLEVKEVEGKFIVDVVNKAKLDEFRENNVNLSKERDELKAFQASVAKVVGDDIETFANQYKELTATAQQVKDGKLKGSDQVEAEVNNRIKTMKDDFERALSDEAKQRKAEADKSAAWEQKFNRTVIGQAITSAAINPDNGVEPTAIPDIIERGSRVFKVKDNGAVIPMDGEAIIYGSDGATPMTPDEWMGSLKKTAPHFFKRSAGGGAEGGAGKGLGGMSQEEIAKLTPMQKIELARKAKG